MYNTFENFLRERYTQIENCCNQEIETGNYDGAFFNLNEGISDVYRIAKVRRNAVERRVSNAVHEANTNFQDLSKKLWVKIYWKENMSTKGNNI